MNSPAILESFTLSEAQQAAALARGGDVAVTAGAGTGKTRTLVARYLALLADGLLLRQVVAITFTRKAAREMRNRVRQEAGSYLRAGLLSGQEKERWQRLYNELDAARIGTIHQLCADILRTHPAEVGIDPQFAVLDETQAALLVQEAAEAALAWVVESADLVALFSLLYEGKLQELIVDLLNKRLAAKEVLKTLPADTIFAHWESRLEEAQAEAIERLLADPDFIAARNTLLRNQAHNPDDKREFQRQLALNALNSLDGESTAGKLRELSALDEIKLTGGSQKNWPGGKEQLEEVKAALRLLRDNYRDQPILSMQLNELDEALAAAMPAIYRLFSYALAAYQNLKAEREGLDFDDLEALAIRLLEEHAPVRDYWQGQVGALLVDEFQDTNEHQCHFIRLLCPDPGKLFIVGDAKQSIYRFRGADVAVFAAEKEQIGREGGDLIDLDLSYRAHAPLLQGMNALLGPVLGEDAPDLDPWVAPFAPLKPGTKTAGYSLRAPYIEFHLALGSKGDALSHAAAALAGRLVRLHEEHGLDYGEMAVLCRASGSFGYYENAFDKAGIPYMTVAGKGFYNRPEIRDLLNALQAIADPHDDLALTGLLRSPACGLSDVSIYWLARARAENSTLWDTVQGDVRLPDAAETERLQTAVTLIGDLNQQAGRTPAADLLKRFLDRTYYRAIMRHVDQTRALRNVAKLLNDIHKSELIGVSEFLEYVGTLRDSGSREGEARATAGGALQIMSIHAAKGLEFPVVILGDAGSGGGGGRRDPIAVDARLGILYPLKEDKVKATSYEMWADLAGRQEEAESDRLLYVALTRAEQLLIVNSAVKVNKNGSLRKSGWLTELAEICGFSGADLADYDEAGASEHSVDTTVEDTAVRLTLYEPDFPTPQAAAQTEPGETAVTQPAPHPLQEPLDAGTAVEADDTPQRVWQVIPTTKRPAAPAWVIGSLVHQALALWRFPDADFEAWIAAHARGYGISDQKQLHHAQTTTKRLLLRFRNSALYREIEDATRRLHEVPYTYEHDGTPENGYIDLLYEQDGRWTVVDFKTDRLRDEADLRRMLDHKRYEEQLRGYGRAVEQLLGERPRLVLCLLNYDNDVRYHHVVMK